MNEPQRYHAQNPLDPRAKPGVMFPGEGGDWVRFEDVERIQEGLREFAAFAGIDEGPDVDALTVISDLRGYYTVMRGALRAKADELQAVNAKEN